MLSVPGALPLFGVLLLVPFAAMWVWRQRNSSSSIQLPSAVSAGWLAEFKQSTSDRR